MIALAFVVVAGAAALARVVISLALNRPHRPLGTLVVNVSGAFALGALSAIGPNVLTVVGTAGLGSFTTFSTLSLELTVIRWFHAVGYGVATLVLGIGAAYLGIVVT